MGKEHGIEYDGKLKGSDSAPQQKLTRTNVYYEESKRGEYVHRAIIVDLYPQIKDIIKTSPMRALYKPDYMVFGSEGARNNWYLIYSLSDDRSKI